MQTEEAMDYGHDDATLLGKILHTYAIALFHRNPKRLPSFPGVSLRAFGVTTSSFVSSSQVVARSNERETLV